MKLTMNLTLSGGRVVQLSRDQQQSFVKSLGAEVTNMSDEDLKAYMQPQDSDYIYVPVRMLSAAEVQNATVNFGHNDGQALKDAVQLFNDLVVLKDHRFTVDNWVGRTEGCFWDDTTQGAPAGVTGILKLDTKADPKACRGVVSGALDSVSVTISFEYEKSHPKMSDMDFYCRMGEVVDGKTVQALVTKVNRVYETSLVWQGADQYAKTVRENGIDVPGVRTDNNSQSFHKEEIVDPKKLAALLGLSLEGAALNEDALIAALNEVLAKPSALQAQLTALETTKTELSASVTSLTTQLATKTDELTQVNTKLETLQASAKIGEATLSANREEALRLYNLVEGDKGTDSMRAIINSASLDVALSFQASYKDRAEAVAPLHCSKCGCKELTRQNASQPGVPNPEGGKKQGDTPEHARLKAAVSSIHS